jgi:hypothetical protein
MQTIRADSISRDRASKRPHAAPVLRLVISDESRGRQVAGLKPALQALGAAYDRVAGILRNRMQHASADIDQISELGVRFTWVSERRRLVQTYLESGPEVIAYAYADCRHPEQIQSLAETASELASKSRSLTSALGLLNYIDDELGWSSEDAEFGED